MATTVANNLILAAARKMKDSRTSAGSGDDTGHVYTSALWVEYLNRAVRDFLKDMLRDFTLKFGARVGAQMFADLFPEYVKTSGALTLSSGSVARPSDCLKVIGLTKTDYSVKFEELEPEDRASILTSSGGLLNASSSQPLFYEEGSNIKTLGVTTGDVYAIYLVTPADLAVSITAIGNGTIYATAANLTYTAATKLITVASQTGMFAESPVNKIIMFRTATIVYLARVAGQSETATDTLITVTGDALPAGNIAAPNMVEFVVSDRDPDGSDLLLNPLWHGEILERMVRFAEQDSVRISTVE